MTDFKQLLTAFERFAYGTALHSAFTDMLDWMLLPFKMHDSSEEQQAALDIYRNHKKVNELIELVKLVGDLSEGFCDTLGELYMQAISNGHNGQYFTPEPICDLMAAISVGTPTDGQTVADCACGSGRMLLSAAKINRHLKFYGADLDITCCKMALINMLLNSLQAEITHMNSLINEFYRGYKVSTTMVNGYHMPYYIEFTEPEQSQLWLKSVKEPAHNFNIPFEPVRVSQSTNGVQGTLF